METSTTLILLRDNNPVRMPVTQYKTLHWAVLSCGAISMLYKVVLNCECMGEILKCELSNESYWAVLSCQW